MIHDPGLRSLPAVFEYLAGAEPLASALPDEPGPIHEVHFLVLKHHSGRRCTFEVDIRTARGCRHLIGKVHAVDRSDVYRAMTEIARAGFGKENELSIPQPVAYVPELCLLLQEKVDGPSSKKVFLGGDERQRIRASERCARWLARFHAVAPQSGPVSDVASQVALVDGWCRTLDRVGGAFGRRARCLGERLVEAAPPPSGQEMHAGHGSYSCNQIVFAGTRTVTFDWDGHDVADPARDVARFVVALQRLAFKYVGSFQALDKAADAFLETYQSLRGSSVDATLPWWRAATCLRLAKYEANRPGCPLRDGIVALLDEGVRILSH